MLLNNFYTLHNIQNGEVAMKASITFNRAHPIFEGHFPGHPVVPGVCMMQILREVMEQHTGNRLSIATGDNLKFLAVINPDEHKEVEVAINFSQADDVYSVNGSIQKASVTFFKFKGTLRKI